VTFALIACKGSAVHRIALDKQHEAAKQFVLSLPVAAHGTVLELEGRAAACVVPIVDEPVAANVPFCRLFREQGGRLRGKFAMGHLRPIASHPGDSFSYDSLLYGSRT
jgi:hypothetical protein